MKNFFILGKCSTCTVPESFPVPFLGPCLFVIPDKADADGISGCVQAGATTGKHAIVFFGKECQVAEESRCGIHYDHACLSFLYYFHFLSRSRLCFKYFLMSLDLLFVFSKSRT
jgi:hypothetical protein